MAKHAQVTIDDVYAVYPSSKPVTQKQLDGLQRELGAELPRGLRDFLTRFGHGWVNDWLQIYLPDAGLLKEQRESLVRDFHQYTCDYTTSFDAAKLAEADMRSCVQIGINQDVMRLFACSRFPGSVFAWSGLTITRHKAGVEVLDPFAAMHMDRFAYFFPADPAPEFRSLACQSKRLEVKDVVHALKEQCKGTVHVIDVDEGPGMGMRTPAFWVFPEKLGAKLHVYGVESAHDRRVYLTFGASPTHLPMVESLIEEASGQLAVKFKSARWY
jgi:hypothetical protein